jgi:hypothetical protein
LLEPEDRASDDGEDVLEIDSDMEIPDAKIGFMVASQVRPETGNKMDKAVST